MTTVTVFGTGNMGSALGELLTRSGVELQHIGPDDDAQIDGDVVILAVPYEALTDIASTYGDQLAGKVVVDITNPVDFDTMDALNVPAHSSAAAELQALLPDAHVAKAFNVNFAETLSGGTVGNDGPTTTVLVASAHDAAKTALQELVQASGAKAIDAGRLVRARELEALGSLQITLAAAERISWSAGFALTR